MKKLYGVTTAMITPFDGNDRVDLDATRKLTRFLVDAGVNCLYPCGTTGEMFKMTSEERERVAEAVVDEAGGRATVFIHTGAMRLDDTIRLSRHACEIGADGVGVVTPAFFSASQAELYGYYCDVSRALPDDFPMYLYNIPQCAGNDLSVDTAKRLFDSCKNVAGIKYSFADMHRTGEYLRVGFSVLQGADRLFLPSLAMGLDGTVSGVSTAYPEPFVRVYKAWLAGNIEEARIWQNLATRFVETLRCGASVGCFKAALEKRGIPAGHARKPALDLTKEETRALYDELTALEAEL